MRRKRHSTDEIIRKLRAVYERLDRFGRVIESNWDQENVNKPDPYHTTIAYDYNSNITVVDDEVAGNDTIVGAV